MKYAAFIPARSGSKRLPNKNIKLLGDKPLVLWTLESCIECPDIGKVIFSTDSEEYFKLISKYISSPKLVFHKRSSFEAGDNIKIFDYLKLNYDAIFQGDVENMILALPTMPFRNAGHVSEAIRIFESNSKPLFSAVEYDFHISFAFDCDDNNNWSPVFENSPMISGNTRSQDQLKYYHPNGAIYIRRIKDFKSVKLKSLYDNATAYLMNKYDSIDIDTDDDFAFAQRVIEKKV
jgi:CMP-N-acetylneuraminic acid synthetase